MAAENHANDIACVGHTVTEDGNSSSSDTDWCPVGMQAVSIDITGDANNLKCGTQVGISVCMM